MTDWIDFAEIRARVSLEDVLLRLYGLGDKLKRQGDKLVGPCPIHQGDSPRAFHADLRKGAYFCFSRCRRGGNAIDFVAAMDGVPVREAALKLHRAFLAPGAPAPCPPREGPRAPPAAVPSPSAQAPPETQSAAAPSAPEGEEESPANPPLELRLSLLHDHPHLVKDRGLSLETLRALDVGYCARGILRGMIAVAIRDEDGDLVAYAGRRLKSADIREHGKYRLPRGFRKELVLYNLDRAKTFAAADGLCVVEGFFSTLALVDRGFPNVVATMGCAMSAAQAELLAEHASHVAILYDGDASGRDGARAAKALLEERGVLCSIVELPEGAEPEDLPIRLLRWAVNGARLLELGEIRFTPRSPR